MNRRQKIIVSVTGIFIVLLALVGITFAYFLTRIQGNTNPTSISVTTADLKLVYGDGNNTITATNVEPGWTNDGESGRPEPKTFTVTNEGNETVENFNIYLEDVINSLERKEDLIYTITCQNTTVGAVSTECEDFVPIQNEVTSDNELIFPSVMSVIATDTLDPATEDTNAEVHTYTITVTYKNLTDTDQSIDMGKRFSARVNIYDGKTKFLATEIIKNAKSTNTVDYNKSTYILPSMLGVEENTSIPAKELSLETERVLSYSFDDDGTSFYYRGNVEDNYVTFANMCWRVVRINGDGSIKVILEDQDEPCSETMNGNWDIGNGNYGYSTYEPGTLVASDGSTNEEEIYIADYLNGNTDYENSMALAFQDFQNDLSDTINEMYNKNINQMLQSGGWCLGETGYDGETEKLLTETEKKDKIIKGESVYYDSYFRNAVVKGHVSTLKCNGTILDTFGDEVTPMYIGALNVDEVIHSGNAYFNSAFLISPYNYLRNEYQKTKYYEFLLLSLSYYDSYLDTIFTFGSFDAAGNYYFGEREIYDADDERFRPTINLSKDTKIISGNGTSKQAYVVG